MKRQLLVSVLLLLTVAAIAVAQNFSLTGIHGVLVAVGSGINGTGVQRVNEATDSQLSADIALIKAAVEVIDNAISGAGINISQIAGVTPQASICDHSDVTSVDINLSAGTGNTQIRALSGSTVIYLCGYTLFAGGDSIIQWIYGDDSGCATNETDIATLDFSSARGYSMTVSNGGAIQMKTAAGKALCVERTSSVTLRGYATILQQ